MKRSCRQYIFRLILGLVLLFVAVPDGLAQVTSISGTINEYSKVTAVGVDWVNIGDNDPGFAVDDKVLLIQMRGAELSVGGSIFGSSINSTIGDYGYYEFIVIDQITITATDTTITFRNNIRGSYHPESYVQLVKLPQAENVSIDGLLTCPPWDESTGTGGVLTFLADNNVYLNADIDVSEKGFDGGISDIIQGLFITTNDVDPDLLDFTEADNRAARKGRGIGSHTFPANPFNYSSYARGKGRFGSGGGGGNGQYAGGGGGSSYATGGPGGNDLAGNYGQGFPGEDPNTVWITNRYNPILMGGGGGAGGKGSGGSDVASDGGRGGGIIIILADTIFGNGYSIISNGEDVWPVAENNGGAGGGGAAGAIVISASYKASSPLTITADGGNGGHTRNFNGYGGGGSGGLIFTNKDLASFGVTTTVDPGEEGATNYLGLPSGSPSGFAGQVSDSLLIRLNGFLFNTIVSDITKSRIDSICFGESAPLITGTTPVGGIGPYTFEWEKRLDSGSWNLLPDNTKDIDLSVAEADTFYLRRIVKDSSPTQIIDTSKAVMIIVQPLITGNTIGYDTIICWNQDPDALLPIDILGGGNFDSPVPDSTFSWRVSTINNTDYHTWAAAPNTNDERIYDPGALMVTTYYYRAVQSGVCYDTSNVITVEVLPSIIGNTVGSDEIICEDDLFTDLTGPVPTGGDGSYIYEWRRSNDDSEYLAAFGTVDQLDYNPDEPTFLRNQDQYFRRFVWSGADNVCVDSSNVVTLKMWSDITGNTIYSDQTITSGGPVGLLTGDPLGGSDPGAGFTFLWQQSADNISWFSADGANTDETYQPAGLTDTTYYRRTVTRLPCADISNVIVVNVHPSIDNNTISTQSGTKDTIICNLQDPNILPGSQPTGGDEVLYLYLWEQSTDNIVFTDAAGLNTNKDYDPGALSATTFYRRTVTSGESFGISDTITITVLPDIAGNTISGDQTICYNTGLLIPITGPEPSGGAGPGSFTYLWEESADNISWVNAAGLNTNIDYDPGTLTIPMYYRRIAKSGLSDCCVNTSNSIMVGIHALPIGTITGVSLANTCAGDVVTLSLDMTAAGQAPYNIILDDGIGGTLSFTATTDVFDHDFNPVSTGDFTDYTYTYSSLIDDNGCVSSNMTGTENLRVYTVPSAVISAATPDNVCGDNVILEATPSVGTGLWSCPDATIVSVNAASTSATTIVSVDEFVTYTFTWEETNVICTDVATIDITFWEQPGPVDAGLGQTLVPLTTTYMLSATAPTAGSGQWTAEPDNGQIFSNETAFDSEVTGLVDGLNVLRWSVKNGDYCLEESDTIMLTVNAILIPSGYSPNMDGINDMFVIRGLDNLAVKAELVITDMNGVIVYESPEYHNEWDGHDMHGNLLPEGTYYYFLRIKEPDQRQLKGYIIIKRSLAQD